MAVRIAVVVGMTVVVRMPVVVAGAVVAVGAVDVLFARDDGDVHRLAGRPRLHRLAGGVVSVGVRLRMRVSMLVGVVVPVVVGVAGVVVPRMSMIVPVSLV